MKPLTECVGVLMAMFAMATAAEAAEPIVVKLDVAMKEPVKIVAGGTMFYCEGARCEARTRVSKTLSLNTCRQLAKRVGAITEFGDSRDMLEPEKLAACKPSR